MHERNPSDRDRHQRHRIRRIECKSARRVNKDQGPWRRFIGAPERHTSENVVVVDVMEHFAGKLGSEGMTKALVTDSRTSIATYGG